MTAVGVEANSLSHGTKKLRKEYKLPTKTAPGI